MYCKVIIIGGLTKETALKYSASGSAIAKNSIAYSEGYGDKKKTHYIDIVAFSKTAEALNTYCKKGSKIMVEGIIQFEQWTAQDGTNKNRHSLRVDTMKMLDSKSDNQPKQQSYQPQQQVPEIDISDSEIPF